MPDDIGDRDSVLIAAVFTIFLHLVLYYALPQSALYPEGPPLARPQSLELVLTPSTLPDPGEERFVMAAPDREQLKPEDTPNISDRDQLAAQEQPALPSPDETPQVEGDNPDSSRIVQGNPFAPKAPQFSAGGGEGDVGEADSPLPERVAAPADGGQVAADNAPEVDAVPLPDDAGVRVVEERGPSDTRPDEEEFDTIADGRSWEQSAFDGEGHDRLNTPEQQASQSPTPRPRQMVERSRSYGPLRHSTTGTIRIGKLAINAQYSEFGEYWTRVGEIIEQRWRNILYNMQAVAFSGAQVTVKFYVTREGEVEGVEILYSNAGRLAETISTDAISSEAPYFRWTPDMILRMGDRAPMSITFHY